MLSCCLPASDFAYLQAFNAIAAACDALEAKVCEVDGCMPIGYLVQPGSVICAVNEFEVREPFLERST